MRSSSLILVCLQIVATLILFPSQADAFSFNPNYLISDIEFTNIFSMDLGQIQNFLERGTLASYKTTDIDGKERYASDIIWRAADRNGVNPQVILVMLQKEQSLVTDADPLSSQFDWAMGYGVCDSCNYDNPDIQRFKGFAKQINSATLQLTEGYLADIDALGQTVMGYAPGEPATIDEITVVPANNATAALYTYTPHLHGNENFARLWQAWFVRQFPTGSLLQNTTNGGVWLIQFGYRRPITSRAAFISRYDEESVIPVAPPELEAYPVGRPISLPNYSLVSDENGAIYLLVDDTIRHIVSMEAFRAIGFNLDEVIEVPAEELAEYSLGEPITATTVYPQGALLQDAKTGGVYFVENSAKHPIVSREILLARFGSRTIVPATQVELATYATGDPVTFPDSTLVGITDEPTVYVISEGKRRSIPNEQTFISFGWQWADVVWTDQRSVEIHPLGEELTVTQEQIADDLLMATP